MKNNMNKMHTIIKSTLLLTVILVFTSLSAIGQNKFNKLDENGLKQGVWIKMWNNGVVKYKGEFMDDSPVGTFKYYYPSGKEKSIMTFSEKGTRANNISFHENGKKMAEGVFINQKKEGTWKYFSDVDEKLVSEENYKDGLLNGETITYYIDDQKPFEVIEYKEGNKEGKWIKYFPDGQKMTETTYKNNKLEGIFLNYDPDGKLLVKGQYKEGEMDGTWYYYDETGKLYRKEVYNKGYLVKSDDLDDDK
jgi:antitoxin component YwqK of YwqJK toxin-antitoxin module